MTTINPKKNPLQKLSTLAAAAANKLGISKIARGLQHDLRSLKSRSSHNRSKRRPVQIPMPTSTGMARQPQSRPRMAAVAIGSSTTHKAPQYRYGKDGSIEVSHTEFIGTLTGHAAFTANGYSLNALNATLFPWLSGLAVRYETYQFLDLTFHYNPSVSTSENGVMMFGFDPDCIDAPPSSMQELLNLSRSQEVNVWAPTTFHIDKTSLNRVLGQRYTNGASTSQFDNAGLLFTASTGCTDAITIGNWRVSYRVKLQAPQLHSTVQTSSIPNRTGTFQFYQNSGTNIDAWYPFAHVSNDTQRWLTTADFNSNPVCPVSNADCTYANGATLNASSLFLPVGSYIVAVSCIAQYISMATSPLIDFGTAASGGITWTTLQSNAPSVSANPVAFYLRTTTITQTMVNNRKNYFAPRFQSSTYGAATISGNLTCVLSIMPVSIYTTTPPTRRIGDFMNFAIVPGETKCDEADCKCPDEHKGPCSSLTSSSTGQVTTAPSSSGGSTLTSVFHPSSAGVPARFDLSKVLTQEELSDFEIIQNDANYARRLAAARLESTGPFSKK